jgi:hypothetical protein
MRTSALSIVVLALAFLVAAPAGAEQGGGPPLRSTMAQIATRVATDLATAKDPAIFIAPLRSDEPITRGNDLANKLVTLVAGAFGPGASVSVEPVTLATALTLARKAKWIVHLQPEIARGQLQVNADAYRPMRNVWDRARQPSPAPAAHGFASGRIDGEVRAYLAPVQLVTGRIDRVAVEDRDVVAVACGDLGDGGLEIVTLGRRRIAVGRARAGHFVARKSAALRDLSPVAPAPLREPIGGIAIVPQRAGRPAFIDVGITDRAKGSRFDLDLQRIGTIAGVPFATPFGDACANFQGSTANSLVAKCADADAPSDAIEIDTPLDASAAATYVAPDGSARAILATRDPRTSELRLRADGKTASLPGAGAQVALGDLDQDGSPEIISTLDVLPQAQGAADALVVTTWQSDGTLRERARTPVPSGVRAVAACPPDGAGPAAIVVATQGELWIVR